MKPIAAIILLAVLLGVAAPAGATLLSDLFGVTLTVDGWGRFNHSWAPATATADYLVDDNYSAHFMRPPHGGEMFDVEAVYFDDDPNFAYVAVVSSFPVPDGLSFLGTDIPAGDLGVDLGRGSHGMGIDIDGGTGLVADTDPGDWYQSSTHLIAETGPTNFAGGVPLGYATLNCYDYGLVERGYGTYVFELTIARSLLGSPMMGDHISFDWTMGCRNDVVHLGADFDTETPPVPEPGTILLLGTGLLGAAGFIRRRRS